MLRISRVHIDYQKNPVGIAEMPQFGWEIVSDKRNVIQKAYTLQISKNPEFTEFVYDSGRVVSGKSAHLIPESGKLESATKYFVRVKADDGVDETPWSETAYFITGLTEGEVWKERGYENEENTYDWNRRNDCVQTDGKRAGSGTDTAGHFVLYSSGGASMRGGNVSGVQYRQYECDTGTLEAYRRGGRRKI